MIKNLTKQEESRELFNYECDKARGCRYSKNMISCHTCPQKNSCDIQKNIDKHFNNMK
jgi:hypothetical protein